MSNNPQFNTYYQPKDVKIPIAQPQKAEKKPRRWVKWLAIFLASILLLFLLISSWLTFKFFSNSSKVFGGNTFSNAIKAFKPTTLKGEGSRNTNILITGNSVDDPGHPGASLTDSIMILSLDLKGTNSSLISIPRDLYVNIPGSGYHKINEAYTIGEADNFSEPSYPKGGIGLLEKTISDNMAMPIDYYVLVNYSAIRNTVNAIGGVDVEVNSKDPRGIYDPNIQVSDGGPLRLPNGVQHLDGQTALNLARARGAEGNGYGIANDFNRTENQRRIMDAIQKKVFSPGVLFNPFKISSIFDAVASNIKTDLEIDEARKVATRFRKINNQLGSHGLTNGANNYLRSYTTPSGQSALVPAQGLNNFQDIQDYLKTLTGRN